MNAKEMTILYAFWSVVTLLFCWFYEEFYQLLTPFLIWLPTLFLLLWSLAFLVWGADFLITRCKTYGVKAGIPILLMLIVVLLLWFSSANMLKVKVEYRLYYDKRLEIISSVQQNTLDDDGYGNIQLPAGFRQVSAGGEIHVFQQNDVGTIVGFWVRRGMLDSGSVLVIYSSQEIPPTPEALRYEEYLKILPLGEHWYYVDAE